MIKAAITGADTPQAGELIRILVNHPEVILTHLSAPGREGISVTDIHHGLIGETNLKFSGPLPSTPDCSVVFICGNSMTAAEFSALQFAHPDIRTIIVDEIPGLDYERSGVVYGLPEINRKPLVRGAVSARVPAPAASATLVPLYPLALHMLLNDSLRISIATPEPTNQYDKNRTTREINDALTATQRSFENGSNIEFNSNGSDRLLEVCIDLSCPVTLEQIMEIYEIYDDHNFAFPLIRKFSDKETIGTNKCVFSLQKPDDSSLRIVARTDAAMRGGAGEAVHIMNLLFGLHEKTGITLKAH